MWVWIRSGSGLEVNLKPRAYLPINRSFGEKLKLNLLKLLKHQDPVLSPTQVLE